MRQFLLAIAQFFIEDTPADHVGGIYDLCCHVYKDGAFIYDMTQLGLYTGVTFKF